MFDIGIGSDGDVFGAILYVMLLEGIGVIITVIAFVLILITSIKLFRGNNIPGSKLIFYSIIGTLVGTVLSATQDLIFHDEGNYIFSALVNICLAVLFLVGAYGFLSLAKYTVNNNANNAPPPDA